MALEHKMIEPFADRQVRDGVISYGVSSYGYDLRVADEFRIFKGNAQQTGGILHERIIDPKHISEMTETNTDYYSGVPFIIIPPNSFAYTEGFNVLKENTIITNFQPHFHLRGKAMQVEAIFPDGRTQIVSYVKDFNFNWMTNYIYADDAAPVFPKGTVIHVSAWYDNTKNNPTNPDPEQWVGYGDRTVDEMAHAWMNVVYLDDTEYKALLAERKAKTTNEREREQQ